MSIQFHFWANWFAGNQFRSWAWNSEIVHHFEISRKWYESMNLNEDWRIRLLFLLFCILVAEYVRSAQRRIWIDRDMFGDMFGNMFITNMLVHVMLAVKFCIAIFTLIWNMDLHVICQGRSLWKWSLAVSAEKTVLRIWWLRLYLSWFIGDVSWSPSERSTVILFLL